MFSFSQDKVQILEVQQKHFDLIPHKADLDIMQMIAEKLKPTVSALSLMTVDAKKYPSDFIGEVRLQARKIRDDMLTRLAGEDVD